MMVPRSELMVASLHSASQPLAYALLKIRASLVGDFNYGVLMDRMMAFAKVYVLKEFIRQGSPNL